MLVKEIQREREKLRKKLFKSFEELLCRKIFHRSVCSWSMSSRGHTNKAPYSAKRVLDKQQLRSNREATEKQSERYRFVQIMRTGGQEAKDRRKIAIRSVFHVLPLNRQIIIDCMAAIVHRGYTEERITWQTERSGEHPIAPILF